LENLFVFRVIYLVVVSVMLLRDHKGLFHFSSVFYFSFGCVHPERLSNITLVQKIGIIVIVILINFFCKNGKPVLSLGQHLSSVPDRFMKYSYRCYPTLYFSTRHI
jgi:hypothetical protein